MWGVLVGDDLLAGRLEARNRVGRRHLDHVHLTGQQRGRAGVVIGDRDQDQLVELRYLVLVPVVRVGHENGPLAGHDLLDHEGAGPHGVLDELRPTAGLFPGGGTCHPQVGQAAQNERVGRSRIHLDGPFVDLAPALEIEHAATVGASLRRVVLGRVGVVELPDVPDHRVRIDRRPIVKRRVATQLEDPLRGVLGTYEVPLREPRNLDRHGLVLVHVEIDHRVADGPAHEPEARPAVRGRTGGGGNVREVDPEPKGAAGVRRRRSQDTGDCENPGAD